MDIIHPEDSSLVFPLIKYELDSPEIMMENLFYDFFNNNMDYDTTKNILYRPYEDNYKKDSISCHFTEEVRLNCKTNGLPTLIQVWKSLSPEEIKSFNSIDDARWTMLSKYKAGECNFFNPALCINLYLRFNDTRSPIKIIDPSAGWGDRMITALACGDYVSKYDGYDPNKDLIKSYKQIIKRLDIHNKCRIFNVPFENAEVLEDYYDLGVTSPPYFDLEEYSDANTQSIYGEKRNYKLWLEEFYKPYLKNLHRAVRKGGKIIIYVSNFKSKGKIYYLEKDTIDIFEKEIMFCKLIKIGEFRTSKNGQKFPRPFFVFEKF